MSTLIAQRVHARLAAWPGHEYLSEGMRHWPRVNVYVAGGLVRDAIVGRPEPGKDIDIFLSGPGHLDLVQTLTTSGEVGVSPFGSARWRPTLTTAYADLIPINAFFNGLQYCSSIVDALHQFDFTANAIAMDLRTGEIFDPHGGIHDAHNRVIRAVRLDYPDEPITPECKLSRRTVLAIRLHHYARQLDFDLERSTEAWLKTVRLSGNDIRTFGQFFFVPDVNVEPSDDK